MGHVSPTLLDARPPGPTELYEEYLRSFDLLGHGFVIRELVRAGPRHIAPHPVLWPRMVPTLALALELRSRLITAGARGLAIAAAYRPLGGERDSQHKHNAALDLDLLRGDVDVPRLQQVFAEQAARLWSEHADLKCGAGTYAPQGRLWTRRVHIDTGHRHRCWQGIGSAANGTRLWASRPAIYTLAHTTAASDERIAGWAKPEVP